MEGRVGGGVSAPATAVGSRCGAAGLGQHFGAPAESNTQCKVLVHVPKGS